MSKFNVGDRVKYTDGFSPTGLVTGNIYTVSEVKGGSIYLEEMGEYRGYYSNRFELFKAKEIKVTFNVGDKVKCIDAGFSEHVLTYGNTYTIRVTDEYGFVKLAQHDDWFRSARFEKLSDLPDVNQQQEILITGIQRLLDTKRTDYGDAKLEIYTSILKEFYGITFEQTQETTVKNKVVFSNGVEYVF